MFLVHSLRTRHSLIWRSQQPILLHVLTIVVCLGCCSGVHADSEARAISDLLEAGEYVAALNILEDLKVRRPCDPDLLFLEARAYETVGETEQALLLYQFLIDIFPKFPGPYNNLAGLYAAIGDLETAEDLLLRGLATDHIYQQIQNNLTTIYVARAAVLYRNALGINSPLDSQTTQVLGIQLPNAVKLYRQKDPNPEVSKSRCEENWSSR